MLLYAILAVLLVAAVLVATPMLKRNQRLDEVDRFHIARSLTTSWSDRPQPPVHIPAEGDDQT